MQALQPGDHLAVAGGTYSFRAKLDLSLHGRADAPIRITAADPAAPPVLTRPDARQNVLNLGESGGASYLHLQGLEITGGSTLIRLYDCHDIWIDQNHLHHAGHEGLTANSRDTREIYITGNTLHDFTQPEATGEALYLGANHGRVAMSYSVIAGNHVYRCGGTQGDGIELKQGSHHNWIVGNHVHDTRYPAILVYGTGGNGINVIERNTCYRSGDNTLQVQGEAIVRNNLLIAGGGAGFASTDHQDRTRDLRVVHNTILSRRRGANLSSWNDRPGMIFANNLVYSEGAAVRFPAGARGVAWSGNVLFGALEGVSLPVTAGRGLADFRSVSWDGTERDARPLPNAPAQGAADPAYLTPENLNGTARRPPSPSGAFHGDPDRP